MKKILSRIHSVSHDSVVKKALLVPYFAINSLIDPTRGDMVANLGDITGFVFEYLLSLQKVYLLYLS
jgi:hypothetical protein